MSDTAELNTPSQEAPESAIPNFSATAGTHNINGRTVNTKIITFGEPLRTVVVRELDLGDSFDIAEISSEGASPTWQAMAMIAKSILSIDGVPLFVDKKPAMRDALVRLTPLGASAVARASAILPDNADAIASAKN